MRPLDRLPPWTTTGVGSLPFRDPARGAAHAAAAYELPFHPQLPALDGDMISEWLGADGAWSPTPSSTWTPFLAELDRTPPAHRVVKLQVTGPVTLGCAAERAGARQANTEELGARLAEAARERVAALHERGFDALLIVDEPALALAGTGSGEAAAPRRADAAERAWAPLRQVALAWGLHVCCGVDWALIERAVPDVLLFDLAVSPVDAEAARVLGALAARGGRVVWGAVRPHVLEHGHHGLRRLAAIPAVVPAQQSLVSPACGSGRMTAPREHELATACADVARTLRADARLTSSRS